MEVVWSDLPIKSLYDILSYHTYRILSKKTYLFMRIELK